MRALAWSAAIAVAMMVGAPAQQPEPASLTGAQKASVKRLEEIVAVVNAGETAAMLAYVQANSVQSARPPAPAMLSPGAPLAVRVLEIHRYNSQGLDLVRVAKVEERGAFAVVRNRRTGHAHVLSVEVEPEAPHRITRLPYLRRAVEANLLGAAAPAAQSEQARFDELGSYLQRLADADQFSGAVVIAREGKPVFARAHGYADREKKIANTLETPFLLGSMNKLFTGLAIGQLVEQGKLS